MNMPLLPFARRGIWAPYLITPRTDAEATTGRPTLIAAEDLPDIIRSLRRCVPDHTDLISKFEEMARSAFGDAPH